MRIGTSHKCTIFPLIPYSCGSYKQAAVHCTRPSLSVRKWVLTYHSLPKSLFQRFQCRYHQSRRHIRGRSIEAPPLGWRRVLQGLQILRQPSSRLLGGRTVKRELCFLFMNISPLSLSVSWLTMLLSELLGKMKTRSYLFYARWTGLCLDIVSFKSIKIGWDPGHEKWRETLCMHVFCPS